MAYSSCNECRRLKMKGKPNARSLDFALTVHRACSDSILEMKLPDNIRFAYAKELISWRSCSRSTGLPSDTAQNSILPFRQSTH